MPAVEIEICRCVHELRKHLHVQGDGDGPEYGRCKLCPCRVFRRDAEATRAANAAAEAYGAEAPDA